MRSAGTKPIRLRMACRGERRVRPSPSTSTVPSLGERSPKIVSSNSLRPAPTSPARPTISPAPTSRSTPANIPGAVSPRTRSTGLGWVVVDARSPSAFVSSSSARPTIMWIRLVRLSSAVVLSPTLWPSRSTEMRSASSKTSSSRWETKIVETPSSRSVRTTLKSDSTSSSVSELVGSSRIRTRASIESARAISTICFRSGRSRRTGSDGSRSSPSRSIAARARARVVFQSTSPARLAIRCPRKMFSAIERSGARVVSCVTVAMPWRSASVGVRNDVGRPAKEIDPASGCSWPDRIRSIVDFPEPFSPMSACTSAGRTLSLAPRRACTPP